jgi:hypothetical protein
MLLFQETQEPVAGVPHHLHWQLLTHKDLTIVFVKEFDFFIFSYVLGIFLLKVLPNSVRLAPWC